MRKATLVLIVFSLALMGCSNLFNTPIKTFDDEFKNTKTHTLAQTFRPVEYKSEIISATLTFSRTITNLNENVNLYFLLSRSSSSFKVDKKGFMKANGNRFEFISELEGSDFKSKQESSTTSTTTKDSTSVKTTCSTEVKNINWYDDKFVVQLTPEMVKALLMTDELLFRFYLGPEQATFSIKGNRLQQVKNLFEK